MGVTARGGYMGVGTPAKVLTVRILKINVKVVDSCLAARMREIHSQDSKTNHNTNR